jgi:transglutaminase-like putative cysteine protease
MSTDDGLLHPFLRSTPVIDWSSPPIVSKAAALAVPGQPLDTARACFLFVRDEIRHSRDHECGPATWRASDVLRHGTGYCYAKSHLLAALLRANGIAAGFCYQRLSVGESGPPYSLHGLNAVRLPGIGWYRVDARGNKPGVTADFAPPTERLAFAPQSGEECDFENVLPDPLEVVLAALRQSTGWADVLDRLPDVTPAQCGELGLTVRASASAAGHRHVDGVRA